MKNLKVSYLLDFYGNLFPKKQREILEMYYQDDMSLSEIASVTDMTRQGVYDNIKRGEKEIISLEDKLKLMDRFLEISNSLDNIGSYLKPNTILENDDYEKIKAEIAKVKAII
ncbi:MAG: DNA-binding protein [Clostridia bacterium]|nr:DNA-binding protein [Clostridia bacterium]MBO7289755.1 DNA-binding protein [Clostridia bacterium]